MCVKVCASLIVRAHRHRRNERRRRERVFSAHVNIFGMTEQNIIETYLLSSDAILGLLEELRADLEPVTRRSYAISCMAKLLSTLHFLAYGSFQRTVATSAGISQSSFSSVLSHVLNAMSRRMQLVCDSKRSHYQHCGEISRIGARLIHFRNSVLFQKMRDGEYGDGWLLGKLNSYIIFCFLKIISHINEKYVIAVYVLFLR